MSEIWNGPGDDWYPGDDDEEFKLDQAAAAAAAADDIDPFHEYDPDQNDGITTDDFDHWPGGREFPS